MNETGKQAGNGPEAGWLLGVAALILGAACVLGVLNGAGVVGGLMLGLLSVGCFIAAGIKGSPWWFGALGAIVLTLAILFDKAMSHCCMM